MIAFAKSPDMHIHPAFDMAVVTPDTVEQLLARISPPGVAHAILEQTVFG